jgi:sugar phosphate isomerase/epimerase
MIEFTNYTMFRDDIRAHGLEYAARHTAELGFDSVEFLDILPSDRPILPLLGTPEHVKEILNKNHLSVACYTVALQLLSDSQADIERQMMNHIDFAAAIGAPMVHHTLVPNLTLEKDAPSYDDVLLKIFDSAERIAAHCNKLGMTCLYEPQGMYFNGVEGLKRFFDKIKGLGYDVGICGDFANSIFVDTAPELVFEHFADSIKHVHIKDFLATDDLAEIGDRKAFRSQGGKWLCETDFGAGSINIDQCFNILKQVNYKGKISFEFVTDDASVKKIMQMVYSLF